MDNQVTLDELLKYERYVYRVAMLLSSNHSNVDDIVQDTWIKLIENPPSHHDRIKGYLRIVVAKVKTNLQRGLEKLRDKFNGYI